MPVITVILQAGWLALREIFSSVPHDAGALIVYALVATFAGLVLRGSRSGYESKWNEAGALDSSDPGPDEQSG